MWAALAGVALSAADKFFGKKEDKGEEYQRRALALRERGLADAQKYRDYVTGMYDPVLKAQIKDTMSDVPAGFDRTAQLINKGFSDIARQRGVGIMQKGSVRPGAYMRGLAIRNVEQLGKAYGDALERKRAGLASLGAQGAGMISGAQAPVQRAYSDYAGAEGEMGDAYMKSADATNTALSGSLAALGDQFAKADFDWKKGLGLTKK